MQIIRQIQNSIYSVISLKEIVIYKNTPSIPRAYDYLGEIKIGIFSGLRGFFIKAFECGFGDWFSFGDVIQWEA